MQLSYSSNAHASDWHLNHHSGSHSLFASLSNRIPILLASSNCIRAHCCPSKGAFPNVPYNGIMEVELSYFWKHGSSSVFGSCSLKLIRHIYVPWCFPVSSGWKIHYKEKLFHEPMVNSRVMLQSMTTNSGWLRKSVSVGYCCTTNYPQTQ